MGRMWIFGVLAALAGVLAAGSAQAGLIPTNVSITPDGSNFRWTYAVVVLPAIAAAWYFIIRRTQTAGPSQSRPDA